MPRRDKKTNEVRVLAAIHSPTWKKGRKEGRIVNKVGEEKVGDFWGGVKKDFLGMAAAGGKEGRRYFKRKRPI